MKAVPDAEYEEFIKAFKEKYPLLYDAIKDDKVLLNRILLSKYRSEVMNG